MANQEQLDLLLQGVDTWHTWRRQHEERPDLSKADLSFADLRGADLWGANLNDANLNDAGLSGATLSEADLNRADLSETTLSRAELREADLRGADLSEATLIGADLIGATLRGANLSKAIMSGTTFGNVDLRTVKGLETIIHNGPSTIGTDTIMRSEGDIPEVFLREAGLSDPFITYARSLAQNPIDYYSCFISVRLVSPKHAKAWGWAGKEYSFHN